MADTVKQSPRVAFGRTMEVEKPDPSLLFEWEKQKLDVPYNLIIYKYIVIMSKVTLILIAKLLFEQDKH